MLSSSSGPGSRTLTPGIAGSNPDRKSTRLNSSHMSISYAVFCLKKKNKNIEDICKIFQKYDLSFSLVHNLHPGSVADPSDDAQFPETNTLRELTQTASEDELQFT